MSDTPKPDPERLVSLRDCHLVPDGTHVSVLPGGYVLLNATPTETRLVELYAAECLRLKPPEIIAKCQQSISDTPITDVVLKQRNLQLEQKMHSLMVENVSLKEDYEACRRARVLDGKELLIQRRKALRFGIAIGVTICSIFMKVIGVLP